MSRLVPAGVPRGLSFLKARIAARLEGAPLLFFAVVIGIALTFRVAIGWARTASDQPVADPTPTATTTNTARPASLGDAPTTAEEAAPGAAPTVMPADTISGESRNPKLGGGIPKRKPRTHGRR